MSYWTMATMARDADLQARCKAAAAKEIAAGAPGAPVMQNWMRQGGLDQPMWLITARPDWVSAWDYAAASQRPEDAPTLGSDAAVITDGMILSAVTAVAAL